MAQLKKPKNRLGSPPPKSDVLGTLQEPETAPAKEPVKEKKVDGRTLRKTGMTQQFNTRVTKKLLDDIRAIAKEEGRTIGKVLERAVAVYKTNTE